uniref:Uncharacterized protein n=1 Tax=viral metagenome TaxID=1070528 RepID=A0A6C0BJJ9_9ZZZZ
MGIELIVAALVVLLLCIGGVVGYFYYSDLSKLGEECDPQLENQCGEKANCQSDESGKKGICFPSSV